MPEESATLHLALRISLVCIGEWKRVYQERSGLSDAKGADKLSKLGQFVTGFLIHRTS
jgi:hypothetical protein